MTPDTTATRQVARPKIGCTSWAFHLFTPGTNPEAAIDTVGELGFEGIDLILLAPDDIKGYWHNAKLDELGRQLERNRLEVAQFVLFQPVVEGLSSTNADERARALDNFEAGCRIGAKLGAPLINIVAPWPREMSRPGGGYLPRFYDLPEAKPGDTFHIDIAPGFDWDTLWASFVQTTRECLQRAKAHGLKFTIEHHTHCMIPDAPTFLLLWNEIRDPALGYNMDVGWTLSQREYPPVAIHKVKEHLMNFHMRDIDGLMRQFVHIGEGVMDFAHIAQALQDIGYSGYLSIEQDKHPGDMKEVCARYLAMMKELLA